MADDAPKGKKKGKKIPIAVLVIGGGVLAYYLYTKYKGSSSSTAAATPSDSSIPDYSGDSGGGGGGGGSPATTPPTTATDPGYGTQTTPGAQTAPIFDTAQPGNPYGAGVAYVEPGVGDLPPGVLPVAYNPPNTTTLSPASGSLASNPAQGGHSL